MILNPQTFSLAIVSLILMKLCACVTVYESKGNNSESTAPNDDGKYRPSEYNDENALYRFGYKVNAVETGDMKQHIETRLKNEVKGAYFVTEPNGASRFIQYVANAKGFNAVVRHQFGVKYARKLNGNNSTPNAFIPEQTLHKTILDKVSEAQNSTNLPKTQSMAFDRFLQRQRNPQQSVKFRQSSPQPITNRSSLRFHENSTENSIPTLQPDSKSDVPTKKATGRQRQYEVIDPEVDIDIRRSIPKPFLNLAKLMQPRKE